MSRETTLSKLILLPSEIESLKGKNLLLMGANSQEFAPIDSKFFPFRVVPFSEGYLCTGKQTESHKSCRPCQNSEKSTISIHVNYAYIVSDFTGVLLI